MGLTRKQRAFIEHYLANWNAAEAARKAGYSEKAAKQAGYKLMQREDVQAAISARISELTMTADEVLIRLGDIARGSIAGFLTDEGRIDIASGLQAGQIHLVKRLKRTPTEYGEAVDLELYDRQAALVQIGRYHKLWVDSVHVDWRRELEGAGLNADEVKKQVAKAIAEQLAISADAGSDGSADSGSDVGSD